MSQIIIFASFFFISFNPAGINTNYNHNWQFFPLKLVSNRLRSADSRSQVVPRQVPVEFSRPRQNRFEWEQIHQTRNIKLYYQIILFSPTDNTNLNLTLKTTKKPCSFALKNVLKGQGKFFPKIINPEIPIPFITNNPMEEYIALSQDSNFMATQEPQILAHLEDQSQDNSILNPFAHRNFYCATNPAVSSLLNLIARLP